MEANVDDIARELAALTQRFDDLGARLGEAARALEEAGAPPANGLVEALAGAHGQFVALCSQTLSAADAAGVPRAAEPQSLHDLEPLLAAIGDALRARARREALERTQQNAAVILDRALTLIHADDPTFAALVGCHTKARAARAAVLGLTELESDDAHRVVDDVRTFADLLTLVETRDALDDDQYAQLEESVSRAFGRPLAVATARGRLGFPGDFEPAPAAESPQPIDAPRASAPPAASTPTAAPTAPPPEPPAIEPETPPEPRADALEPEREVEAEPEGEPAAEAEAEPVPALATIAAAEPAPEPAVVADPSAPDETAQWWLAAWARWSGWKSSLEFAGAVREELSKYPYLLSVPIQKSPEYEDGLLAYGYSILMDHVEKQNPGCVGNALNSLKPGQSRPVGDQLYDYLITEGRLRETYADFVKNTLVAALPEPGVWFQFRVLESKEDTRILQRPSARIGDTELSGQRLASDGQRYSEHKFTMRLGPLTTRFVLVSADVRDARGAGFKLVGDGAPSDSGWVVSVSAGDRSGARIGAKRVTPEGLHVTGLGREHGALWVAVFNPDPGADRRYELSVFLRKDTKSPFKSKG
jgi:outer membrane biosynthesis protein TonB